MRIYGVIWKERLVEKIWTKHAVTTEEIEDVLFSSMSHYRRAQKGRIKGEDVYVTYGRTEAGRYLTVFFVHKSRNSALPISARDMTKSERRYYEQKK